jgi:hypothetical protein
MQENKMDSINELLNTSNNDCVELKNIKYKTMILNGKPIKETKTNNDMNNLEKFLEDEKNNNKNEPWSKLNKTVKTLKILDFVENYKNSKNLNEDEKKLLLHFLKDCLDRKRLQRVKDVVYDKTTGTIKDIPSLFYNKASKNFTLKNETKRVSTLKSLAQKKNTTSIKNKNSDELEEKS